MVGRQQGQPAVARQIHHGQRAVRAVDARRPACEVEVPHLGVSARLVVGDQHAEDLALQRAERLPGGVGHGVELVAAVEPDAIELAVQRLRVHQQADDALDVVGIDVRDHQQVEMARAGGQVQDALAQGGVGVGGAAVDQDAMDGAATAVFDPQAVAVRGGKHLDAEHGRVLLISAWGGGGGRVARAHGQAPLGVADRDQREGHKHAMRQQPSADAA